MRTTTATEQKVLNNADGYAVFSKVEIADPSGTFKDLTSLGGYDWVDDIQVSANIDDQVSTARLTLGREVYALSLAPFKTSSKFNALGPLIRPSAEIKISTATLPKGLSPTAGDWRLIFHGYVDTVDWATQSIQVSCRDLGAHLQKRFIRKEISYSNSTGLPVESVMQGILDDNLLGQLWQASYAYGVGDRVKVTVGPVTYSFVCTSVTTLGSNDSGFGLSGTSAPSWPTVYGATVSDNNLIWTNDGSPKVTLNTPVSPSWAVKTFVQSKKSLLDALKDLADQLGWSVRYLYDSTAGDFVLKFVEPDRTKSVPDWTLDASHYIDVRKLAQDATGVRNFIQVVFGDTSDLNPDGTPKRKNVWARDQASINAYDEQWMELTEASTPNLWDHESAQNLANNILADLKEPKVDHELELHYFWPVELGDLMLCKANGIHYDADQQLAVATIDHHISMTEQRTVLGLRGTPAAQFEVWLERGARPGLGPGVKIVGPTPPSGVAATSIPGGASVRFAPPTTDYAAADLHLSTSSGFTPSAATLKKSAGAVQRFDVADLMPGTTYYGQIVAKDAKGNVSSTSGEFSFTAGYTVPAGLQPGIAWGFMPLNGDFEAANTAGAPPDAWTETAGTWGVDFLVDTTTKFSGARSIRATGTTSAELTSQTFAIASDRRYRCEVFINSLGLLPIAGNVLIDWLRGDLTISRTDTVKVIGLSAISSWTPIEYYQTPPSDAAYARIRITKGAGTGTADFYVDRVSVTEADVKSDRFDTTGTPGNAVSNTIHGRSSVAAGATSCTITNALVTVDSDVTVTPMDIDNPTKWKAVPAAGSFTVSVNVAPAANWRFTWKVES